LEPKALFHLFFLKIWCNLVHPACHAGFRPFFFKHLNQLAPSGANWFTPLHRRATAFQWGRAVALFGSVAA